MRSALVAGMPFRARDCLLAVCLFCGACAGPGERATCLAEPEAAVKTVYLVSHGWHAGIVFQRADLTAAHWPVLDRLPMSKYLEVGWGDRDYYRSPDPSWAVTLKAALLPTRSVLHLVAFDAAVASYFPRSEIVALSLSESGFQRLSRRVAASFARDAAGNAMPLGPGLYGASYSYLSTESYHLFNTCNVWTARAIAAAGCPIAPATTITVERLMGQARDFGQLLQPAPALPHAGEE